MLTKILREISDNFITSIGECLRPYPQDAADLAAMAAGIENRPWSMEDVVALDRCPVGEVSAAKRWLELEMNQKSRDVLEAAERWLMAVQAKTAADGELRRDESEQAELDAAEVDLATAIMVWRNAGRPDSLLHSN